MPEQPTLRISEIFWSSQGEGVWCGTPAVFIRLAGCSLHCPCCDTAYSWHKGVSMTVANILRRSETWLKRFPNSRVVISGGEPLEQDLGALLESLQRRGWPLALESNGLHFQPLPPLWLTVSPKEQTNYFIHPRLRRRVAEIKLLVTPQLTKESVARIRVLVQGAPLFLQPQHFDAQRYRRTLRLFRQCQRAQIPNVRLGFQLHYLYGIR